MPSFSTLVLAGGQAKRFPGKLDVRLDGIPLLLRVLHNVADFAPLAIAGRNDLSLTFDAALDCPILIDEYPGSGPLGAMLSSFDQLDTTHVAVVAGDMPLVTAAALARLAAALTPEDDGVIATHDGRREPLLALYDRREVLRLGRPLFASGERSVAALVAIMRMRDIAIDGDIVANINHLQDAQRHFSRVEGPS
ncbi:MAG: molybdenum cofactor guanylyltransferase [Vulcanimicrobiaceae bacterium]